MPTALPDGTRSGSQLIAASLLFAAGPYVSLGTPAALTSVLNPTHEFTVLVRTARTAAGSTGFIIGQADAVNTSWSISSLGGSRVSYSVGGVGAVTAAGTIQEPTWNTIALVNRSTGGGAFAFRCVLDGTAGTAETVSGVATSTRDIMMGARRNLTNADSASPYSGNLGCVAIWNSALTDDQIHYAMGYITPDEMIGGQSASGLIAYYPCNETTGTTTHDCVGGFDGTCSTAGLFSTAQFPKHPESWVGDSLANGSGSQTGTPPGDQVVTGGSGTRNMRSIYVYGFSGQNCAFILTQIQLPAYAPFLNWTQCYIVGAHDLGTNANVTSFLSTAIAALPHSRYIVIGQRPPGVGTNGTGNPNAVGTCDYGTTLRAQFDSMNNTVRAIYGSRWVDAQNNAVAQASLPTEANDMYQRRTPVSLCSDSVHMLDNGYTAQSVVVDQTQNLVGF